MCPATRPQASVGTSFRGAVLDGASGPTSPDRNLPWVSHLHRERESTRFGSAQHLFYFGRRGRPLARWPGHMIWGRARPRYWRPYEIVPGTHPAGGTTLQPGVSAVPAAPPAQMTAARRGCTRSSTTGRRSQGRRPRPALQSPSNDLTLAVSGATERMRSARYPGAEKPGAMLAAAHESVPDPQRTSAPLTGCKMLAIRAD